MWDSRSNIRRATTTSCTKTSSSTSTSAKQNIYIPSGTTDNYQAFCEWYEQRIKDSGGIDLQILGIGSDGHIAFNEPSSSLGSRTRIKTLARQTIEDNARFFDSLDQVPIYAITMGVGTILEARKIILLANGTKKAAAVAAAVEGPVTSMITASALQLHRDAMCIVDREAASELKMLRLLRVDPGEDARRPVRSEARNRPWDALGTVHLTFQHG